MAEEASRYWYWYLIIFYFSAEEDYFMDMPEFEKVFKFSLKETLLKTNRRQLLSVSDKRDWCNSSFALSMLTPFTLIPQFNQFRI